MARQEDEALERLLTRTLRSQTASGDVCPSAEDVAAYLERSLDAEEMRRVELHLSSCARCTETLALLVESEPVAASAPPPAVWWSWSAWRWAVPAAAVLVIGVWFASTLQNGREPASQMAQYKQAEAPKKEADDRDTQSSAESTAQSATPSTPSATEARSRRTAAGAPNALTVPEESARANQAPADLRREAEKASERSQSLDQVARAASETDAAAARPSTPAQPSADQPRALAKAEESRADAALADPVKEGANAGFAPPVTSATAPAGAPAAPPTAAEPPAAPAAGRAARSAAGAAARSAAAAPAAARRQETADAAPQAARTAAGFAPLVLRTRSGSVLWRIAGSVIERSTDGGTTWTTEFRASASISTGVVAADDTVWLVGASGLVLRRPAAGGWRVVPPPSMDDLAGVSEAGTTAVTVRTAGGRQFRTTDSGATWTAR